MLYCAGIHALEQIDQRSSGVSLPDTFTNCLHLFLCKDNPAWPGIPGTHCDPFHPYPFWHFAENEVKVAAWGMRCGQLGVSMYAEGGSCADTNKEGHLGQKSPLLKSLSKIRLPLLWECLSALFSAGCCFFFVHHLPLLGATNLYFGPSSTSQPHKCLLNNLFGHPYSFQLASHTWWEKSGWGRNRTKS